jgi:U3 small nucleolar RNA-associated protein 24
VSSSQRKTRKFAVTKRLISANDLRLRQKSDEVHAFERRESHAKELPRHVAIEREKRDAAELAQRAPKKRRTAAAAAATAATGGGGGGDGDDAGGGDDEAADAVVRAPAVLSGLFFSHNTQLGPPYHVLIDTNFINFSIQNKLDMFTAMLDCLFAKCTLYLTECVVAELERLGPRYRIALRISRDPRFKKLVCTHKGIYADDCLCERVTMHRCYIVATCDKDLRRRLRKIPGVPIMYIHKRQYTVERMPEASK